MPHNLTQTEWESFFEKILTATAASIKSMGRTQFRKVINERFYHHQFSNYLFQHFGDKQINVWTEHILFPEAKTPQTFTWQKVDITEPLRTRQQAIGTGTKGNYDFVLNTTTPICLEWKGPNVYSVTDVAQVMLKLFAEQPDATIKIFSAIITSAQAANAKHLEAIATYFKQGVQFALNVLKIQPEHLKTKNLYVYIATIPDNAIVKWHWGPFRDLPGAIQ